MNKVCPPTLFIIFGATGDLFQNKILPALFHLNTKKALPSQYAIVAYGRRDMTDTTFQEFASTSLQNSLKKTAFANQADSLLRDDVVANNKNFIERISYVQGEFDESSGYERLALRIQQIEQKYGQCTNKLFYCAVPPQYDSVIFKHLASSGLTEACSDETGWTRILVEKPFGKDVSTAQALDEQLAHSFNESQIFRIDHYLGKETIQNLLAFRLYNPLFASVWNNEHIDSMSFSIFETKDVSQRASFYDGVGALRDVGQNHLLQMYALVTMEIPPELTTDAIRHARATSIASLEVGHDAFRARYEGFAKENGVSPDSSTETFFSITAQSTASRWQGVPFHFASGKALDAGYAEIRIVFKTTSPSQTPNELVFRIQPRESVEFIVHIQKPGLGLHEVSERTLMSSPLTFEYSTDVPDAPIADAYEKVLFDAMMGDQTLFASSQEVQAGWSFVDKAQAVLASKPLLEYKKGERPAYMRNGIIGQN